MGRAVFTALDGTLLGSDQKLSPTNHDALEALGQHGILRVVVTGRSLFSCRRVLDRSFPIDLLVTASGAGIFSFPRFELLFDQALTETEVSESIEVLNALKLDFMVHDPVPDNHRFRWYRPVLVPAKAGVVRHPTVPHPLALQCVEPVDGSTHFSSSERLANHSLTPSLVHH